MSSQTQARREASPTASAEMACTRSKTQDCRSSTISTWTGACHWRTRNPTDAGSGARLDGLGGRPVHSRVKAVRCPCQRRHVRQATINQIATKVKPSARAMAPSPQTEASKTKADAHTIRVVALASHSAITGSRRASACPPPADNCQLAGVVRGCVVMADSNRPGSDPLEHQRAVGATEAEVVLQGSVDLHLTRGVSAVIQIAIRILIEDVDGGWRDLMV